MYLTKSTSVMRWKALGFLLLYPRENAELQGKMVDWQAFARQELERYVDASHYQLLDTATSAEQSSLTMRLDINIVYGNRALRYWVGFGAGKGSVNSTLLVVDNQTGEKKLQLLAESELSMGAFGGDMEQILKNNIKALVDQYPKQEN